MNTGKLVWCVTANSHYRVTIGYLLSLDSSLPHISVLNVRNVMIDGEKIITLI